MGKFIKKEEIILLFLQDPFELCIKIQEGEVERTEENLQLVVDFGHPLVALRYSAYVDCHPRDELRKIACKDPMYAYWYAYDVDGNRRKDTATAAYRAAYWAETYELTNWAYRSSKIKEVFEIRKKMIDKYRR
ncbi:hypothetical protein N8Z24_00630 [bacterium]|nr:hypothetical protein [bacterium]